MSNQINRWNGIAEDRFLMFCPVGFKNGGTAAMISAIGHWGNLTFDKGTEYSNNPPNAATHLFINIAVSATEDADIGGTDFGAVSIYRQSDGWSEQGAANDLGLGPV